MGSNSVFLRLTSFLTGVSSYRKEFAAEDASSFNMGALEDLVVQTSKQKVTKGVSLQRLGGVPIQPNPRNSVGGIAKYCPLLSTFSTCSISVKVINIKRFVDILNR